VITNVIIFSVHCVLTSYSLLQLPSKTKFLADIVTTKSDAKVKVVTFVTQRLSVKVAMQHYGIPHSIHALRMMLLCTVASPIFFFVKVANMPTKHLHQKSILLLRNLALIVVEETLVLKRLVLHVPHFARFVDHA
jgi:hypothetical protein